jgi:hypothetical protein
VTEPDTARNHKRRRLWLATAGIVLAGAMAVSMLGQWWVLGLAIPFALGIAAYPFLFRRES